MAVENTKIIRQENAKIGDVNMENTVSDEITKVENLSDEIIDKCENFAEKTMENFKDNYNDRNQSVYDKIKQDFFIGKIGESCVVIAYERLGIEVFNTKGEKGANYNVESYVWGRNDLIINSVRHRVKSQTTSQAKRYGLSWTFNLDPRDPILDNPEGNVIFVEVDDIYRNLGCDIYPPYKIKELKFTEPKREALLGKKTIVLAENIPYYKLRRINTIQSSIDNIWG